MYNDIMRDDFRSGENRNQIYIVILLQKLHTFCLSFCIFFSSDPLHVEYTTVGNCIALFTSVSNLEFRHYYTTVTMKIAVCCMHLNKQ
jgi:hypothetical protein